MFCKLRTNNVKPFYRQILACVHPKHVHRETWWNYTTNVSKVLVLNKSYVCIFNSQQYVQKYMTLLNKSKISICKTIDGKSKVSTRQYLKKISIYTLVLNNGNVNICTKILKKKSFVLRCFFLSYLLIMHYLKLSSKLFTIFIDHYSWQYWVLYKVWYPRPIQSTLPMCIVQRNPKSTQEPLLPCKCMHQFLCKS